jgi:soluble lytic murein transglycosylase-like protein
MKLANVLGILMSTLFLAGSAISASAHVPEAKETKVTKQGAALNGGTGENARVSSQPKGGQQARPATSTLRTRNLGQQAQNLSRNLVLGSLFGNDGARSRTDDTRRQLAQRRKEPGKSQAEQRTQDEELRQQAGLDSSGNRPGMSKDRAQARITQLQAKERAGLFERPPASGSGGGGADMREQELETAREEIVAQPVAPISYARYVQIYKTAAKRYGFAKDWYVLAAVGKVESNHGENTGPSSAGAMGPMQFLPSTWKEYGVDGNGDGVANIMDPEDSIPAAAAYLKDGGAPEDWYAALYTYNRAGWYVRKVLGTAETYRQQVGDDGVEPYV